MSGGDIAWVITLFLIPPGWSWLLLRVLGGFMLGWRWPTWWAISAAGGTAAGLIDGDHVGAAGAGASLIVALAIWWYRRRKRRSAAALLGAKSLALRAALVRRARQAARPRPVLQPSPRGA